MDRYRRDYCELQLGHAVPPRKVKGKYVWTDYMTKTLIAWADDSTPAEIAKVLGVSIYAVERKMKELKL